MPHGKEKSTWEMIKDMLTMKPSMEAMHKAGQTGKGCYKAPTKAQDTSYLKKQIERQERLKKKKKKKKDPAMDALSGQ